MITLPLRVRPSTGAMPESMMAMSTPSPVKPLRQKAVERITRWLITLMAPSLRWSASQRSSCSSASALTERTEGSRESAATALGGTSAAKPLTAG